MAALPVPVCKSGNRLRAIALVLILLRQINTQFRDCFVYFLHVHPATELVTVPQENQVGQHGRILCGFPHALEKLRLIFFAVSKIFKQCETAFQTDQGHQVKIILRHLADIQPLCFNLHHRPLRLSQQFPLKIFPSQPAPHVRALWQQEHGHLIVHTGVADHVGVVTVDVLDGVKYGFYTIF